MEAILHWLTLGIVQLYKSGRNEPSARQPSLVMLGDDQEVRICGKVSMTYLSSCFMAA